MHFLKRFSDQLYSLMRLIAGFLFACHGAQKLFGVLGGQQLVHVPLMLTAGIIEFFAGLFIAVGAFTAIAALIASGEMAAAYFLQHAPHGLWPIKNRGELAVLFCFVFLYMASRGDGAWSARGLLKGKRL
jgi:putative oxidoreductase